MASIFLLVLALISPTTALAQTYDASQGVARITVCNKGQIYINVVVATQDVQVFSTDLNVSAWKNIEPRKCALLYYSTLEAPVYMGFAFVDLHGKLIPAHASRLPDFGPYSILGTPILEPASDRFCVREKTAVWYQIHKHAVLNCATFRAGANDPGGYVSYPATLEMQPRNMECHSMNGGTSCVFGDYYLDVIATPSSEEIQIIGRESQDSEPVDSASSGPSVLAQLMQQLATGASEKGQKVAGGSGSGLEHFVDACNAFYGGPASSKYGMANASSWCACLGSQYRDVMTPDEESKYADDFLRLFQNGIAQPYGYGLSKSDPAWSRLHPAVDRCRQ
jgi:hypothetical protein